jgi:hypothetical protein
MEKSSASRSALLLYIAIAHIPRLYNLERIHAPVRSLVKAELARFGVETLRKIVIVLRHPQPLRIDIVVAKQVDFSLNKIKLFDFKNI